LRVVIPKEVHSGERRSAATPDTVLRLCKAGLHVSVQAGAGIETDFSDSAYEEAGATIVDDVRTLWASGGVILKVRPPEEHPSLGMHEADLIPEGALLICFMWPAQNRALLDRLCARRITTLAMDCVPRISRAQKMDALSAMANIAGYRAIVEAANRYPRFFAGQITAAGKIDPAKVLVIGAGVAGLSAIGAARSLGAIVRAFDPRVATRDQVKSMGAEYLELPVEEDGEGAGGYARQMSDAFVNAEMALFAAQAMQVDVIVTTALIPGKPAPRLITAGMVESMKPGSVIVDLAAEQGGNCALTRAGEVVVHKGVAIVGYTDLPGRMASLASQLYSTTVVALLEEVLQGGSITINLEDQVVRGALVTHEGRITWPPPTPAPPPEPGVAIKTGEEAPEPTITRPRESRAYSPGAVAGVLIAAVAILAIAFLAPSTFLGHFTVFVLACFVGWQVVWNVKHALHTPLMSVTNAISGIILIGGIVQLSGDSGVAPKVLGAIAVLIATINIAGGFLITQRMLAMFRRQG